mmetsp:Transcript_39296/g.67912  ORF Transcript_39296/g.67912 Transcript_39296/m.67912 type:complete len:125 (+) Transcript_39296:363-737(+)
MTGGWASNTEAGCVCGSAAPGAAAAAVAVVEVGPTGAAAAREDAWRQGRKRGRPKKQDAERHNMGECEVIACQNPPTFNFPGLKPGRVCAVHQMVGMEKIDQVKQRRKRVAISKDMMVQNILQI